MPGSPRPNAFQGSNVEKEVSGSKVRIIGEVLRQITQEAPVPLPKRGNVLPVQTNLAGAWPLEAAKQAHECAFSRAVCAQQAVNPV